MHPRGALIWVDQTHEYDNAAGGLHLSSHDISQEFSEGTLGFPRHSLMGIFCGMVGTTCREKSRQRGAFVWQKQLRAAATRLRLHGLT